MCKLRLKNLTITAALVELLSFPSRLSIVEAFGTEVADDDIFFPKATDSTTCSCPRSTYNVTYNE